MIKTIEYKGVSYPEFQSKGNASQFAIPFAKYVCLGEGYDIGCMKREWSFPGSIPIDISFDDEYDATNLPKIGVDYIFSSHCLEHINNWVDVMDYWYDCLRTGGVLFLYLPDYSQVYWRPWNNRKHLNIFSPTIIKDYMLDKGYINIFFSNVDLNNSFMIYGEKK
jgi:SAM-dependent methyltransferase